MILMKTTHEIRYWHIKHITQLP